MVSNSKALETGSSPDGKVTSDGLEKDPDPGCGECSRQLRPCDSLICGGALKSQCPQWSMWTPATVGWRCSDLLSRGTWATQHSTLPMVVLTLPCLVLNQGGMVSSAQGPLGCIFYISFLDTLGKGELETIWGGGRI